MRHRAQVNASRGFWKYVGLCWLFNWYVMLTARHHLSLSGRSYAGLFAAMASVTLLTVLAHRMTRRRTARPVVRAAAYASYLWIGFSVIFMSVALTADVLGMVQGATWAVAGMDGWEGVRPRASMFWLQLAVAAALSAYATWEATRLRIRRVVVTTEKEIPNGRIRIAEVADGHFGWVVGRRRARSLVSALEVANPDVVLFCGDMVDASPLHAQGVEEILAGCSPPLGKFGVLGNHEVSAGLEESLGFLSRSGVEVLRSEVREVGGIWVAGHDDEAAGVDREERIGFERRVAAAADSGRFTVLMRHRPLPVEIDRGPDLQLSGHTHGSQFLYVRALTAIFFRYRKGMYDLGRRGMLYVTSGVGTWAPPMRLFARPEVTVVDVRGRRAA